MSFNHRLTQGHRATAVATANKRKHELCADSDDSDPNSRMRKDHLAPPVPAALLPLSTTATAAASSSAPLFPSSLRSLSSIAAGAESTHSVTRLQFFVRMLPQGKNLVIHANPSDSVKFLHEKIQSITRIPIVEQRLIYRGKQLQWEYSLADCDIQNDVTLQLVGRMRSTEHPQAWQVVDDMVNQIFHLYKGGQPQAGPHTVKSRLLEFLSSTPTKDIQQSNGHLQIFLHAGAPSALVMLYMSPIKSNRDCALDVITLFIQNWKTVLPKPIYIHCAIVLEFCKLLRSVAGIKDRLFVACRSCLGSIVGSLDFEAGISDSSVAFHDICPFLSELAAKLSSHLVSSTKSSTLEGPAEEDVRDFIAFVLPIRNAIADRVNFSGLVGLPLPGDSVSINGCGRGYNVMCYGDEVKFLRTIFSDLSEKMSLCLKKMNEQLIVVRRGRGDFRNWCQYLTILKELSYISKLFKGEEETFWMNLECRKVALCHLIVRFAKRSDDNSWIRKGVINFQARRHLAMLLLPEVKDEYEELHEMLIDRTNLLAESFEYIARAEPQSLHGGLYMEFKNEEASGPGVLREWFFLVCQSIFNPQNALFVDCPHDRRRFFPNPASKVDPLHLEYFNFSGRVIGLALIHKVQVGIVFDRVFFLQLAGKNISLEDIRDADPYMYSSFKQILEMDPDAVDQDVLGLTFVREVEELGSMKIVELCPDGQNIVVNSKNRKEYVDLLIKHRFVTSIADQVSHFAQGFADISSKSIQKSFFHMLDPEDFDWMLRGSGNAISVKDWQSHTEYKGYKETDPQILWFWKIVGKMSSEQKKVLLFFWTSIKHLPVEGFGGLASRLYIDKMPHSSDHLPTSHTCFYRLCFPAYPSMSTMQERLRVVTQEHIGCSFGTW